MPFAGAPRNCSAYALGALESERPSAGFRDSHRAVAAATAPRVAVLSLGAGVTPAAIHTAPSPQRAHTAQVIC